MDGFRRSLLINAGILCAVILAAFISIFLLNRKIMDISQKIQGMRRDAVLKNQQIEMLTTLKKESEEAKPLKDLLSKKLPPRDNLYGFSDYLKTRAKSQNIDFGFSFLAETLGNGSSPSFVKFSLTSHGPADKLVDFLNDIERSDYLISLNSVDITNQDLRVDGNVYFK